MVIGLAFWAVSSVLACSCMPPGDPKMEMEQATAVFVGRVYSIENSGGTMWVHFEVSEVWKGPYQSLLTVQTAESSAACGFNFMQSTEYMVYAYGDTNIPQVSLCSRTRPLSEAAEDLKLLGPGTPVSQMQEGTQPGGFDPNRVLAPVLSLISGLIVLGILLGGLFDFRPSPR